MGSRRSRSRSRSRERSRKSRRRTSDKKRETSSRSRSRSRSIDKGSNHAAAVKDRKARRYRSKGGAANEQITKNEMEEIAQIEEKLATKIEAIVNEKVVQMMESDKIKERIEARLKKERAKLEEQVNQQLQDEKRVLIARKRKEQEETRRKQEELDKILEDNARKLEEANRQAQESLETAILGLQMMKQKSKSSNYVTDVANSKEQVEISGTEVIIRRETLNEDVVFLGRRHTSGNL